MNAFKATILAGAALLAAQPALAQNQPPAQQKGAPKAQAQPQQQKPKLIPVAAFDAGQPNASIYKLFDPSEGIVCYMLAPEMALRRQVEGGFAYEGNSLGSISCVKITPPVVLQPQQPAPQRK
jgi:hypothetical protein